MMIESGINSLTKHLQRLCNHKMTEEQIDVMTFKDNKLTHWLKPLLTDQENSRIAIIHHIHDDLIEEVL
jgi:hypothetical protein